MGCPLRLALRRAAGFGVRIADAGVSGLECELAAAPKMQDCKRVSCSKRLWPGIL